MSKFSEQLRSLVSESGESISNIARVIGAERTSIHKALIDERLLPYPVVKKLAGHFQLTLAEREEFFQNYDILLQGEDNYENRKAVCSLFNALSTLSLNQIPKIQKSSDPIEPKVGFIRGELAVHNVIRQILHWEIDHHTSSTIRMYIPPKLNLSVELMNYWINDADFRLEQIFCFRHSNGSEIKNIQMLQQVLPLCLASRGKYLPHYFFAHVDSTSLSPLGYYIVTTDFIIHLSEDLSVALIQSDPSIIEHYVYYFGGLLDRCEEFVQYDSNATNILDQCMSMHETDYLRVIMNQPCTFHFIDEALVYRNFDRSHVDDQLEKSFLQHLQNMHSITPGNIYTIFSELGVRQFMDSGAFEDVPAEFCPSVIPEDRKEILRRLRTGTSNHTFHPMIVRPTSFRIPDYLGFIVDEKTGIYIFTTSGFVFGAYSCVLNIREESLVRVFIDFINSLPGSNMVYSQSDSLRILDKYLE